MKPFIPGLKRIERQMIESEPDLKAWFADSRGRLLFDESDCCYALQGVVKWLHENYGANSALRSTPAGTGTGLLEMCLPQRITYPPLPDGIKRVIFDHSFPHRWQDFTDEIGVEYDARSAFIGCCRYVPTYLGGEIQHDQVNKYIPFRPSRYLVDVTIPSDWRHIGLVPAEYVQGEQLRAYPDKPGSSWQVWLDGQEVELLIEHQWGYMIRQRILFALPGEPGSDPLRAWVEPFRHTIETVERHTRWPAVYLKAYRHAIRAICLHTIGYFHRQDSERTIADPETGIPQTIEVKLSDYAARFQHPEWSAAVWSKSRCRTTKKALKTTKANIISIHGDAIKVRRPVSIWTDDGKIGTFREK